MTTQKDSAAEQICTKCGQSSSKNVGSGACNNFTPMGARTRICKHCGVEDYFHHQCSFSEAAASVFCSKCDHSITPEKVCGVPVGPQQWCICEHSSASEGVPPERIKVVVRAAASDDWIGVAYCKDYVGDPSTIHEYVRAPSVDKATIWKLAQEITHFEEGHCYTSCPEHWTKSVAEIIEAELGTRAHQVDEASVRRVAEKVTNALDGLIKTHDNFADLEDAVAEIITTELRGKQ